MDNKRRRATVIALNEELDISDDVLHHIALGTATKSGIDFFCALVEHAAKALKADLVFVTECVTPDRSEVRTLANWYKGALRENFEYSVVSFPCVHVMQGNIFIQSGQLVEDYPEEVEGMESYIGIPLVSTKGEILGHIVVMNEHPIEEKPRGLSALRIFAARASAELERMESEMQLASSEERYRLLFDTNPLPIFVFDVDSFEILAANRSASRVYGFDTATFQTMRFSDLVFEPDRNRVEAWLHQPLQPDQPWDNVYDHVTKGGQRIKVQLTRRFLRFEGRSACISLVNDITERLRIEHERDVAYQSLETRVKERTLEIARRQEIAESLRDTLRTINSHSTLDDVLIYITREATILLQADAAVTCQSIDGESEAELQVQAHHGFMPAMLHSPDKLPGWELLRGRLDEPTPIMISVGQVAAAKNTAAPYQQQFQAMLAVPLLIHEMLYGYLILYYLDPRHFTDEDIEVAVMYADQMALAIENSQLRQEAQQIAVYDERSRLARELHDVVTQTLWSASLLADVLPSLWRRAPLRAAERLEQLRQLNRVALQEMRALLLGLRPKDLMETPLDALLMQLIDTTKGQSLFQIDLKVEGARSAVPAEVQIAFYRVAQEALNNVIRHANAKHVMIGLMFAETRPYTVTMTIRDDGQGFDVATIYSNHFGTRIMQERANAVGAILSILSEPGHGTAVEMKWFPVEAAI
ncbi:MAG: hypothetical protein OHK0046_41560 [Anaerolineae bacterium]